MDPEYQFQTDEPDVNRCEYCDKAFTTKYYLDTHRKIHLGQKDFKCTLCTYSTVHQLSLTKHIRTHTGEKPYKCPHPNCNYAAARNSHLKSHQLTHKKDDKSLLKLKCPFPGCPHKTARKQHLNQHMKTHLAVKPYSCDLCPYRASQKYGIRSHQERIHNKYEDSDSLSKFQCSVADCAFQTTIKSQLNSHVLTHSEDKPFACELCPYRAKIKGSLEVHQTLVHSTEKPLKCPQPDCNYSCKMKGQLTVHKKVHSDERPFACSFPECNYRSKRKSPLKNHEIIHSGEKPFKCPFCPYSSARKSGLVGHTRVHTEETPFACNICDYRAKTGSNLTRHVKKKHSENNLGPVKMTKSRFLRSTRSSFKCKVETCDYSTSELSSLAIHHNMAHNLPRIIF